MIICMCAFTEKGKMLQSKLSQSLTEFDFFEKSADEELKNWTLWCFERRLPIVFIGAAGIAVRAISEFVNNKLTDSPVLVIDEEGKFIIPILSGHVGGANKLAKLIAQRTGGTAVITTATDVENKFSVDEFAVLNGLKICNRDGIQKVSKKVLQNQKITFWVSKEIQLCSEEIPEEVELISSSEKVEKCDVCISVSEDKSELPESLLYLQPKTLCLGVGCKKGKSFEEIKAAVESVVDSNQMEKVASLSSIDLKQKEEGLQIFAQYYHLPFFTYSSEELEKTELLEGEFSSSDFVKATTGVSNVCERAAVKSAGNGAKLIVKKVCKDGVTVALAEQNPLIKTWSCR